MQGARVWIRDDILVWIGGELKKDFDGKILEIELEDGRVSNPTKCGLPWISLLDCLYKHQDLSEFVYLCTQEITYDAKTQKELPPLRNPDILLGENDLTTLSYLHEPAGKLHSGA